MLATGIKNKIELNVTDKNTAKAVGSGTLEVYATPQMVNLMETCACFSVEPYMEPGKTTVGISLNISHVSATPAGLKVWCESDLPYRYSINRPGGLEFREPFHCKSNPYRHFGAYVPVSHRCWPQHRVIKSLFRRLLV